MRAHVLERPPSLRAIDPRMPAELDEIVQRLLAKDPMARPQHAEDVIAALGDLGGGLLMPAVSTPLVPIHQPRRRTSHTTLTSATGTRTRVHRPARPRRGRMIAIAALVIAAAGALGMWLGQRHRDDGDARAARLVAPRLAPITLPPPIPDAQIDAVLGAVPPAGARHHVPRPHLAAAKPACVKTARRRPAASAALRGRSPC
jgi:hypothetical protein